MKLYVMIFHFLCDYLIHDYLSSRGFVKVYTLLFFFNIVGLEGNSDKVWMVKSFRRAVIHLDVLELSGSLNAKCSTWALSFQQNVGSNYG